MSALEHDEDGVVIEPGAKPEWAKSETEILAPEKPDGGRVPREKPKLITGGTISPIVPRDLDEVARIADGVIAASMVPLSLEGRTQAETRAKLMLCIMKGLEVNFAPMAALQTICVINNRTSIYGDGAIALILKARQLRKFEVEWLGLEDHKLYETGDESSGEDRGPSLTDFTDDFGCIYRIWRPGIETVFEGKMTVRDAKRARLWGNTKKDPWIKYPKRQLFNRARAFALRDGFADILMGLAIAEELQDVDMPEQRQVSTAALDDGWKAKAIEHKPETPMPEVKEAEVAEKADE